jgi:type IV pilus assembly protein PilM
MNIVEKIKGMLRGNPLGRSTATASVLGIDIGSSSIKVVQLRKEGGKAVLETYGAITLGPYAEVEPGRVVKLQTAQIAEALTDLIREASITAARSAVAIPFSSSLTSVLNMPNMPKDQLNKMVPLEARKYIPVSTSEVTMDWFVIPDDESPPKGDEMRGAYTTSVKQKKRDELEILLVAIHNNVLDEYQATMAAVGLSVEFYELEIFSAARGALGHGIAPVLIVDIGAASTKIYVVERGIVRMSHLVHKGSQDLTLYISRALNISFQKAERLKQEEGLAPESKVRDAVLSTLDNVFAEVNRVLLNYGQKYHKNISKVVFCGGTVAMTGFAEYANTKIDNVIEISDPFNKVQTPAFLDDVLHEVGPEFTVAVGLALRQLYGSN